MATCSEGTSLRAARAGVIGLASIGLSLAASTFISQSSVSASAGSVTHSSFNDARWGDKAADKLALDKRGRNSADADPGSLYTVENAIGARSVWQQRDSLDRQITGQGVTVALLDSGTEPVDG